MGSRFQIPVRGRQFDSEYDLSSASIQDQVSRDLRCVSVRQIDLDTAGSMQIREPGYGFVFYGFTRATGLKATEANINVCLNGSDVDFTTGNLFPGKTGRGYNGSFGWMTLSWPAQSGISARFLVFKSDRLPWFGGGGSLA